APLVLMALNRARVFTLGWIVGDAVQNVIIVLVLDRCVSWPTRGLARLLNTAPLAWVGRLSYSLYLWQQPFLNRHSASFLASFPVNVAGATSAAMASYYCLERPLMRIRTRLRPASLPRIAPAADARLSDRAD